MPIPQYMTPVPEDFLDSAPEFTYSGESPYSKFPRKYREKNINTELICGKLYLLNIPIIASLTVYNNFNQLYLHIVKESVLPNGQNREQNHFSLWYTRMICISIKLFKK